MCSFDQEIKEIQIQMEYLNVEQFRDINCTQSVYMHSKWKCYKVRTHKQCFGFIVRHEIDKFQVVSLIALEVLPPCYHLPILVSSWMSKASNVCCDEYPWIQPPTTKNKQIKWEKHMMISAFPHLPAQTFSGPDCPCLYRLHLRLKFPLESIKSWVSLYLHSPEEEHQAPRPRQILLRQWWRWWGEFPGQ